jgi:hypothetical protein
MKQIRTLQILVYILFGFYLLQNLGADMYKGFTEGYNDGYSKVNGKPADKGTIVPNVTLDENVFLNKTNSSLFLNGKYTIENLSLSADVRIKDDSTYPPLWFTLLYAALMITYLYVFFLIANAINKVLVMIYKGSMFDYACIKLLRKAGMLLLIFSLIDYAGQWVSYTEQRMMIMPPLKAVNTSAYDFSITLVAIFIFIIAEAFKQGGKLKEEQELTI